MNTTLGWQGGATVEYEGGGTPTTSTTLATNTTAGQQQARGRPEAAHLDLPKAITHALQPKVWRATRPQGADADCG